MNPKNSLKLTVVKGGMLALALFASAMPSWGITVGGGHSTDGIFQTGEWAGPNVSVSCIALTTDGSGGGCVYVQQGSSGIITISGAGPAGGSSFNTLYLGYDDLNPNAGGCATTQVTCTNNPSTTFDVFFQVQSEDYLIHIVNSSFTAYEKPSNVPSLFNGDGSFDFNAAPWDLLDNTDPDLQLADFHAAAGFGPSPDSCPSQVPDPSAFCNTNNHLTAEFDLTINTNFGQAGTQGNGLYDPSPAFWSGTGNDGATTIISEDFTLNSNGQTSVTPDLNASGDPQQQSNVVPEPSTAWR